MFRAALIGALLLTACSGSPPPASQSPRTSTPTNASPSDPVIAAAGDVACDPDIAAFNGGNGTRGACRQLATSDLLTAGGYTAVLPLGDLQYEIGALKDFRRSYDLSWGRVRDISYPVPVNHEYSTSQAAGYFAYFGDRAGMRARGYYSYDLGSWHLIALNSNCGAVGGCGRGSPQERWLRADLAAHEASCTLAYWHHPRFSSGLHGDSAVYTAFWQALHDAGADVVLVGHDHDYERFAPQDALGRADSARGIREFVVGTGGRSRYPFRAPRPNSEVRNFGTYGILALTLRPTSYEWRFVPEAGKAFTDTGSTACH
ncbi:MAG: metallophosphoesterase [Actinomycetota bacterium]